MFATITFVFSASKGVLADYCAPINNAVVATIATITKVLFFMILMIISFC